MWKFWTARRTALLCVLASAASLSTAAEPAWANGLTTSIKSCPYTILAPGTYRLSRDLNCPGMDAITIRADNVDLRLGGHTLTGDSTGSGVSIPYNGISNPSNIIVRTGEIVSFEFGVRADHLGPKSRIAGLTARFNSAAIQCDSCSRVQVSGNTIINNSIGVYALSGTKNRILRNTSAANAIGIFLSSEKSTVVDWNVGNNSVYDILNSEPVAGYPNIFLNNIGTCFNC